MSLTLIHIALSLALFFSQFCLSIRTSHNTEFSVLVSVYAITVASIVSLFAPVVFPGWSPSYETLALLSAVLIFQRVTAKYWINKNDDIRRMA